MKLDTGKAYLVTGIAGSGKSTIKQSLVYLGYTAYDVDDGMAHWVNRATKVPTPYNPNLIPMTDNHDWLVNKTALLRAISSEDVVFICGSAHDLYRYEEYFTKMFLLQYPSEDAVRTRLLSRTSNSYGKDPKELESILGYWKEYEQKYIERNATVIDCTAPLVETVNKLIAITK